MNPQKLRFQKVYNYVILYSRKNYKKVIFKSVMFYELLEKVTIQICTLD